MRVVRSDVAHGKIVAVDTRAAKALPGVVAVWSAADIPDIPPVGFREGRLEKLEILSPAGARDRPRALRRRSNRSGVHRRSVCRGGRCRSVTVDVRKLAVILDAEAAPGEFSPGRDTEAAVIHQGYGDIDAAFGDAHEVVELTLSVGRHSGVPLETRGAIGRYDAARDILELHGAAKIPHATRNLLARMLDRAPSAIHLYESHVGGGFGVRGELYPEDVLVCVAAMRLGRPVKWIEDRREHLIGANHSREQTHRVRAAVDRDGHILAIDDEFWHDQGAYLRTHAIRVTMMVCGFIPGPYRMPAYRSVGHVRLTNKTPAATYRAPGRFETTFIRERVIDAIAHRLGIDPIEVRRRNALTTAELPHVRPLVPFGEEIQHDTGDYLALLDRVLDVADWQALRTQCERRRASGELVGIGLAMFVEKSGLGPSDGAKISVDTSGIVEVITGGASVGQGFETVIAQVCAETLGVDYRKVRVVHGQTDKIAFGIGAHASRATVMTASATHNTALKVRQKAIEYAAEMMQAPAETSTSPTAVVRTDHAAGASMSLGEIASGLAPTSKTARGARSGTVGRRLVPRRPAGLPLRDTCGDGAGGPRDRRRLRSSATSSVTISAAPSIRRWCVDRSRVDLPKASAVPYWRSLPTAIRAIRWRRRWRTT